MNEEQQEYRNEIEEIKNELDLLIDGSDIYCSAMALLETAFDLIGDADFFDAMCGDVSVFYDEFKENQKEEDYAVRIIELCINGK